MRIVIPIRLTMAHGIRGGLETQAFSLAQGLLEYGHTPIMLTNPHLKGIREDYEENILVKYIQPGSWRHCRPSWWESCYREIVNMHQEKPIDLVLSQNEGALGYIPRIVAELQIPCVVIVHGSMTGELRNRWRDLRSLRGFYRMARHLKRLPTFFLRWKKASPMVQHWIIVNHQTAQEWQHELAIPPERLNVILNGIDTNRFRPDAQARQRVREQFGFHATAPLLIAAGRLEYEKGLQVAIAAIHNLLPQFPNIRLLIAGDGVYRSQLQRLADSLPSDSVLFPGHIPNSELPALLAAADMFLMPTLRDEGLPMSTIEALSSGLPVITSRTGGLLNVIDENINGVFVPMNNANALSDAIAQLLHNPTQRQEMAKAARQKAEEQFSREHMVNASEQVLQDVVQSFRKRT